jgi:hypothetical protein
MALHLEEISLAVVPGAHALVLLDQAGWHVSKKLPVPGNERPPKPKEPNAMVWYFNMQGREVVSINARLEDLATIDAFCKKRNISRSSLMVQAALAFCAGSLSSSGGRHGPLRRGS